MDATRQEVSRQQPNQWDTPGPNEALALYSEASKAAYYFSDWRYKLLTYFLAFSGALALATEWLEQNHRGSTTTAIPFAAGYVVSLMLAWMDYRNMLLLRIAHGVAASIETRWGVGGRTPATDPWAYIDGRAPTGFYSALADLQPFRTTKAWSRRQRWSSYSVTMTAWFLLAAVAFAIGAACIVSTTRLGRVAVAVPMVIGVGLFAALTRAVTLPRVTTDEQLEEGAST